MICFIDKEIRFRKDKGFDWDYMVMCGGVRVGFRILSLKFFNFLEFLFFSIFSK